MSLQIKFIALAVILYVVLSTVSSWLRRSLVRPMKSAVSREPILFRRNIDTMSVGYKGWAATCFTMIPVLGFHELIVRTDTIEICPRRGITSLIYHGSRWYLLSDKTLMERVYWRMWPTASGPRILLHSSELGQNIDISLYFSGTDADVWESLHKVGVCEVGQSSGARSVRVFTIHTLLIIGAIAAVSVYSILFYFGIRFSQISMKSVFMTWVIAFIVLMYVSLIYMLILYLRQARVRLRNNGAA